MRGIHFSLDIRNPFHNMARVPQSKTSKSPYRVQVLDRALAALDVLAARSTECSLVEICTDTGRYRLGLKLFEFGSKAIGAIDLRRQARPYLDRLQRELGETVFFCLLDDGQVLYLEKIESQQSVRTACTVGSRAPAYCTAVGKAMLAELPDAEVSEIVRRSGLKAFTPNTITTATALKDELRAVRSRGYAIDDEEKEEGLRCISAAVSGHSGRLFAAI